MDSPFLSYKSRLRFLSDKLSPCKDPTTKHQNLFSKTHYQSKFYTPSKVSSNLFLHQNPGLDTRLVTQSISKELLQKIRRKAHEDHEKVKQAISQPRKAKIYPSFVHKMLTTHKQHLQTQYYRSQKKNANEIHIRKLNTQNSSMILSRKFSPYILKEESDIQDPFQNRDSKIEQLNHTFIFVGRHSKRQTETNEQTSRMSLTMDVAKQKEKERFKRSFTRPFRKVHTVGIERRNNEDQLQAWNDKNFADDQSISMFLHSQKANINLRPLKPKDKLSRSNFK